MTKLDRIKAARGKVYGCPQESHENVGLGWSGLIQQHYGITLDHPLPSFLVNQMLCTLKLQRATRVFRQDNYDDLKNYVAFAEQGQKASPSR